MTNDVRLEPSWKEKLGKEFEKPYFSELTEFVRTEYVKHKVYPDPKNIFRAFDLCPFQSVEVVLLGQDPYHGFNQANGLCFAVSKGVTAPPSLKNIFKELEDDLGSTGSPQVGRDVNRDTDLSRWARQGVLLLNATLTVQAGLAGSHQHKGWEEFTDAAIKALNDEREHLVFMLWGNYAKSKGEHIDRTKHCVLEAAHPSPFSAYNGFLGCKHFSKANEYLREHNKKEIEW
jgi:uracil-DNA glycosylase